MSFTVGIQLEDGVFENTLNVGGFSNLSGLPGVLGSWCGHRRVCLQPRLCGE